MAQIDSKENSVVAVYAQHSDAENAINLLKKSDFNIKKLAIVGQGYHTEDQVVGYYTTGDRMKHWGKKGAFWGGLWGLLVGSAVFMIPGVGPVMVAGSAVAWIVGALEGAVVVGGLSALGAGLHSIGIPKDCALKYESSIKAGKFLLIAHETAEKRRRHAGSLLTQAQMSSTFTSRISPRWLRRRTWNLEVSAGAGTPQSMLLKPRDPGTPPAQGRLQC
jgi:hypothetical protein